MFTFLPVQVIKETEVSTLVLKSLGNIAGFSSVQLLSCVQPCNAMDCSMPGLPVSSKHKDCMYIFSAQHHISISSQGFQSYLFFP